MRTFPVFVSRLPVDYDGTKHPKLFNMQVGDTAYTLPWGMYADECGTLMINGRYPALPKDCGTHYLKVTRTVQGFSVETFPPELAESYTPRDKMPWRVPTEAVILVCRVNGRELFH